MNDHWCIYIDKGVNNSKTPWVIFSYDSPEKIYKVEDVSILVASYTNSKIVGGKKRFFMCASGILDIKGPVAVISPVR